MFIFELILKFLYIITCYIYTHYKLVHYIENGQKIKCSPFPLSLLNLQLFYCLPRITIIYRRNRLRN